MLPLQARYCIQLTRFIHVWLIAALLASSAFAAETSVDSLLEDQAGSKRPILVFGSDIDDKAVSQISGLWLERAALEERDMLIVRVQPQQVVVQRTGRRDDGSTREVETFDETGLAKAFRKRFEVAAREFVVIVIGKDGKVKRRSSSVLEASEIFKMVDDMPMQQNAASKSR